MISIDLAHSRRSFLRSSLGIAGLTLPTFLRAQASANDATNPMLTGTKSTTASKAKSCIVIYCWGGMSHYESFDPKPNATSEVRGEFAQTSTSTNGIHFCEHLPKTARHAHQMAIIRSVHHDQGGHQQGMYVSLTGHKPPGGIKAKNRENWPSLTAMISRFQDPNSGVPHAIRVPYNMYDNSTLMAGEYGGWLGEDYDPILMKTPAGKPFGGVSRYTDRELDLKANIQSDRVIQRRNLQSLLGKPIGAELDYQRFDRFQTMAADMLLGSAVKKAYDLESEDKKTRAMYGDHIGGQSMLLARRMVEAGVPVVQVCAGAGDLAGGGGDNWDINRGHFPKMKDRLLPVFDRSYSSLLTDLQQRGMLDETLVVLLTDFGRTPKINKNGGRDHYPAVYSLVLAGGGIQGGQVYGSSDPNGTQPQDKPCTPADVHATVYQALGIHPKSELLDQFNRPFTICDGNPLPLF